MQRGSVQLLLVFVALLFLIGGGVYFLQTNRKNEVKVVAPYNNYDNYKSYSTQTLGFSFQYSKDLSVKDDSEEAFNKRGNGDFRKNFKGYVAYEPGKFIGAVVVLDKTGSFDTNPFTLWVFDNPGDLTADGWFDKYWYYPFVWGVFDWTSKSHIALDREATVSGTQVKYKIVAYQPGQPKFIYVSKDQKMYLFRVIGESGDRILSNFKFLSTSQTDKDKGDCKMTGCSGQICSDKDVVTTCEFLPRYACYKTVKCERQADGKCGWTQTPELTKCLERSK